MENISVFEAQSFIGNVIGRSHVDGNFKAELLENPVSVINKNYGLSIKENVKLVVEDQTNEDIIYLNIPKQVNIDNIELTDEELESVSGGTGFVCGAIAGGLLYDAACTFCRGVEQGWNSR